MDTLARLRAVLDCTADTPITTAAVRLAAKANISQPAAANVFSGRPVRYSTARSVLGILSETGYEFTAADIAALCDDGGGQ